MLMLLKLFQRKLQGFRYLHLQQKGQPWRKLIAEALLKYETLDSVQIKSLYETGKMPENSEHELEEEAKPLSYDEIKSKLEENN